MQILELESFPLLQLHVLDLCSLDRALDLSKFVKPFGFGEAVVVLNLVPSAEEDEFFAVSFFVDSPSSTVGERRSVGAEIGCAVPKSSVEFGFLGRFHEVPANSDDGCIERNGRRGRLQDTI